MNLKAEMTLNWIIGLVIGIIITIALIAAGIKLFGLLP